MTGLVRVYAKLISDNTGSVSYIPVLLSRDGPVLSVLRYVKKNLHCRSLSWCEKVTWSAHLLLEYSTVNVCVFRNGSELFNNFAQALYNGTINPDTGLDPSFLYWKPRRTRNANNILQLLTGLSDDLVKAGLAESYNPADPSPSKYEHTLAMAAFEHLRRRAFLGHIRKKPYESDPVVRMTTRRRVQKISHGDMPPSFPDKSFEDLLLKGFIRRGASGITDPMLRINARDGLISLLMHGAGLRLSECFHLYVHDVYAHPEDSTQAVVRIYHPSLGTAPDDWRDASGKPARNRQEYLAGKYRLLPRNQRGDAEFAGWKGNLMDSGKTHSMSVIWRSPDYARIFLSLWKIWLAERSLYQCSHPFAFIGLKKGQRNLRSAGGPYRIGAFKQAHRRAVERIGLQPSKAGGTTPHGHRHAMGQYLTDISMPPVAIQKILHHCSLISQEPYTRASQAKVSEMLNAAKKRLGDVESISKTKDNRTEFHSLMESRFSDSDPDGLLSGPTPKLSGKRK